MKGMLCYLLFVRRESLRFIISTVTENTKRIADLLTVYF